jgi:hypothetical protein
MYTVHFGAASHREAMNVLILHYAKSRLPSHPLSGMCLVSLTAMKIILIRESRAISLGGRSLVFSRPWSHDLWLGRDINKHSTCTRAFRTSESADFSEVRVRKFWTLKTLRTRTQRVCLFTNLYSKEVNISQKISEI